jgi:hypothetical protein
VTNGIVDYEEVYEIDAASFERYRADLASALPFVERWRKPQEDEHLILQPGRWRGTASEPEPAAGRQPSSGSSCRPRRGRRGPSGRRTPLQR